MLRSEEEEREFRRLLELDPRSPMELDQADVALDAKVAKIAQDPATAELEAAKERVRLLEVSQGNITGSLKKQGISITDPKSVLRTAPSRLNDQVAAHRELLANKKRAVLDTSIAGSARRALSSITGYNPLDNLIANSAEEINNDRKFIEFAKRDRASVATAVAAEDPATVQAAQAKILQEASGKVLDSRGKQQKLDTVQDAKDALRVDYAERFPEKVQGLEDSEVYALALAERVALDRTQKEAEAGATKDTLQYNKDVLKYKQDKLIADGKADVEAGKVRTQELKVRSEGIEVDRLKVVGASKAGKGRAATAKKAIAVQDAAIKMIADAEANGLTVSPKVVALATGETKVSSGEGEDVLTSETITSKYEPIMALIRNGEAFADAPYDSWARGAKPDGASSVVETSVRDAYELQLKNKGVAIGAYQFKPPALKEAAKKLGVWSYEVKLTPEIQDKLFITYLETHAKLEEYMASPKEDADKAKVMSAVSKKWRAVADPKTDSTVKGAKGDANKASIHKEEFYDMLDVLATTWDGTKGAEIGLQEAKGLIATEDAKLSVALKAKATDTVLEKQAANRQRAAAEAEARKQATPEYREAKLEEARLKDTVAFSEVLTGGVYDNVFVDDKGTQRHVSAKGQFIGTTGEAVDMLAVLGGLSDVENRISPELRPEATATVKLVGIAKERYKQNTAYGSATAYMNRAVDYGDNLEGSMLDPRGFVTGIEDWDTFVHSKERDLSFEDLMAHARKTTDNAYAAIASLQRYLRTVYTKKLQSPILNFARLEPKQIKIEFRPMASPIFGTALEPFDPTDFANTEKLKLIYNKTDALLYKY